MKIVCAVIAGVAIWLTGCANRVGPSPGDLRSTIPLFETVSVRNSKYVVGCISDKWENAHYPSLKIRPTENGYSVSLDGMTGVWQNGTLFLIDIDDLSNGSNMRLYDNDWGETMLKTLINNCKK